MPPESNAILREWPWWDGALDSLSQAWDTDGEAARDRSAAFAAEYEGRRAAMVFDVVMSRQRRYEERVLPEVARFTATEAAVSLAALADAPLAEAYPFRPGEAETIRAAASALARFAHERRLTDDDATRAWAEATAPIELAPNLDPYVGSVTGIGPALFAYMRMRAGADAIKIDVRVRDRLEDHGFRISSHTDFEVAQLASTLAKLLGCSKLELDQLLWFPPTHVAQGT